MSDTDETASSRVLLRLLKFLVPHWGYALTALAFMLLGMAADLALPQVVGREINALEDALKQGRGADVNLWHYVMLFLGLTLIKAVCRLLHGTTAIRMQQGTLMDIRCALFEATQRHSFAYHDQMNTGQLISRVTRDVDRSRRFLGHAAFALIEVISYLVGSAVLIFLVNMKLALLSLCMAPITILVLARFASQMRTKWRAVMDTYGDLTTTLQENIAGARVVRAFAKEPVEIDKFGKRADTFVSRFVSAVDYWSGRMPLAECLFGLTLPIALCYGSMLAIQGRLEVGDVAKVLLYLMGISHRVRHVGHVLEAAQEAAASADRIFEVLDETPKVRNAKHVAPLPDGEGHVEFRNVSFQYEGGKQALHGVDLVADPGQMVALVGRTGSGKTALVNLLPRFYDVTDGEVRVDGMDVRGIDLPQLRRSVGLIFQETFLFSATVAENIAYGKLGAARDEIESCARTAQAHEFIVELEKGYDTVVGERGITLSGGQKQRIAIARALMMQPRILLMDDATASVDSETERLIQEAMDGIARDRTTFVVAHRLSTVRKADLIVVLEDGQIAECGSHEQLMQTDGMYREIHEEQFAGEMFL